MVDELRETVARPRFAIASIVPILTAIISVFAKQRAPWLKDFVVGKMSALPELVLIGNGIFVGATEMQLVKQTLINIKQCGSINGEKITELIAGIKENDPNKVEMVEFFFKSWPKVFAPLATEIEQAVAVRGEMGTRIKNALKRITIS